VDGEDRAAAQDEGEGKGKKGKTIPARLELRGPDGKSFRCRDQVLLEPEDSVHGSLSLDDDPDRRGPLSLGRSLRGAIEVALFNRRRSLRLVNVVNLEDYTQGVVGRRCPPTHRSKRSRPRP